MFPILIVDPITLLRCGLKYVLRAELGLTTIGEAPNVEVARDQFRTRRWEVVVIGTPPFEQDYRLIEEVKQYFPSTRILLLGWGPGPAAVTRAIHAGASGYLHRDAAVSEVVRAFRRILAGERYISERIGPASMCCMPHTKLSGRERLVLTRIAEGKRTGEIASELKLDMRTVSTYRRRALQKMQMQTNAELIRYVSQHGPVTQWHEMSA